MLYEVLCTRCHRLDEIEKPMRAALPRCIKCGGGLKRRFVTAPSVHYAVAGFYSTDEGRMEGLIGKERAAKLKAKNSDALRRAKQGRLTDYEKSLENI